MNAPSWTKECKRALNLGRDYLGIQNVGNRIMNDLLPGLTGATNHPRYYSFLCWSVKKSLEWGKCGSYRAQKDFLYRTENILLYASGLHDHQYPLTGARPGLQAVDKILKKGVSRLPLRRQDVGRNPSAFDVQNYGPSMNELGLLRRTPEGLLIPSKRRGELLVDAFDQSLGGYRDLVRSMSMGNEIRRSDIGRAARVLCPCVLGSFPAERAALASLIMGQCESVTSDDSQRGKSLRFLLELARLMPSEEAPRWRFPNAAYYLRAGTKPYEVVDPLRETIHGWAVFQMRTYLQYGITGLWTALLREIYDSKTREMELEGVVGVWLGNMRHSGLLAELLPGVSGDDPTIRDIVTSIGGDGSFAKPTGLSSIEALVQYGKGLHMDGPRPFSELRLAERIDQEYDSGRHYALAVVSALLIVMTLTKWMGVDAKGWQFGWALDEGGHYRLSYRSMKDDVLQEADLSLSQFLLWALRKYVVDQHFLFATEKMMSGRNTFHFEKGDRGVRVLERREGGWDGANYIPASLRMLHALGFLHWNEKEDTFRITAAGASLISGK